LFIVEQSGRIRIARGGVLLTTPFLDISSTGANRVLSGGEQGLLSAVFPPGFAQKGYFYVNYTRIPDGATVVARYFVTANPDIANPASEEIILNISQPFPNHNGGQLAFSPADRFLYIGMGDGGSGGDPNNYAQNLNDLPGNRKLLGKLLRVDVEAPGCTPYCIPISNPLLNDVRSEIWALGLRNPFRFSFDRLTGDLYIGDVGQNLFEEIDFQPAASVGGENYGWRLMEGLNCFNPPVGCNDGSLTLPIVEYGHTESNCSVTGGFVYRGNLHPQMEGIYFYGDFCTGRIWGLKRNGAVWQNNLLLDSPLGISSFGEDEAGELYLADYATGDIYRITIPETGDFDGDGKTDVAVYDVANGWWYFHYSSDGSYLFDAIGVGGGSQWKPVPGDYDGDGKADAAVYDAQDGWWLFHYSSGGYFSDHIGVGGTGHSPAPGDYDGDGATDIAVYNETNGYWYVKYSSGSYGFDSLGGTGWVPFPSDYDGDGKTDVAVYNVTNGWWYFHYSSDGSYVFDAIGVGGGSQWKPVPGDYDGDGKADVAVYDAQDGWWLFHYSSGGYFSDHIGVGGTGHGAVPGDYDGDGVTDIAVYNQTNGYWYVKYSSGGYGFDSLGGPGKTPVNLPYLFGSVF
jgi:glucose/arabinose dehydrogenase